MGSEGEPMHLTHAQMRYLLAITELSERGMGVRSSDIVQLFGVSRPSVSRMLRILSDLGILDKDRFGKISLTQAGTNAVEKLCKLRESIAAQLIKCLGLSSKVAEDCALLLIAELPDQFPVIYDNQTLAQRDLLRFG